MLCTCGEHGRPQYNFASELGKIRKLSCKTLNCSFQTRLICSHAHQTEEKERNKKNSEWRGPISRSRTAIADYISISSAVSAR